MTWWVTFRHVVSFLFFRFFVSGVVLMWFHAGSLSLCCVESDGASKVRLYFAPTLRMFLMSEGIGLCVDLLCLYMDCRKMSCSSIIFGIFSEINIRSEFIIAMIASYDSGRLSFWSRIFFFCIMLIASFFGLMSRIFLPPWDGGSDRSSVASGGMASVFHRKDLIHFVRYSVCWSGIPWAAVMNWVLPPIIIWMICFRPSIPGYAFSQVLRLFSIFSMICGHGAVLFMLFPTSAPRYLVVSLSLCILISSGMGVVGSVESERVSRTCCLYSVLPAGVVTVLSLLNFAPEARHCLSRSLKSDLVLSLSDRKTAASSANRDSLTVS